MKKRPVHHMALPPRNRGMSISSRWLQVRCAGFNGRLGFAFRQLFKAEVDPVIDMAMAA
jgi:hypothetical protein